MLKSLPISWELVEDDRGLLDELRAELGPLHPLFGVPLHALARSLESDDVLFEVLDGSERLVEVHLTWSRHPEIDGEWPGLRFYSNELEWIAAVE